MCTLRWVPGRGGLLASVRPEWVGAPDPGRLSPDAIPIPRDALHVTLLSTDAMSPLVDTLGPAWPSLRAGLSCPPRPRFDGHLHRAERPPHPRKDPPEEARPRRTWFLAVADQGAWRRALAQIVTELSRASIERGGQAFAHPESDRFFHLSLFNNREGDPARSIGDISIDDTG